MSPTPDKYRRTLTEDLYTEIVADLEELRDHGNRWADSWLEVLEETEGIDNRVAILATLISALPGLYRDVRNIGARALMAIDGTLLVVWNLIDLTPLEDVVGPTVPDHLAALLDIPVTTTLGEP